jgi:hypothetical protein
MVSLSFNMHSSNQTKLTEMPVVVFNFFINSIFPRFTSNLIT